MIGRAGCCFRICLALLLIGGPDARVFAAPLLGERLVHAQYVSQAASLFSNQAIVARLIGSRFISGMSPLSETVFSFGRTVRLLRTQRIRPSGVPHNFTPSRLKVRSRGALRELRDGLGRTLKRQLVVASLAFLMWKDIQQVPDHKVLLVLQWGSACLLIRPLIRIGEMAGFWERSRNIVTTPVTPILNGKNSRWFQNSKWLPLPLILLIMMLANLGSQFFTIRTQQLAGGPVSATAAGLSQLLFQYLIGFFLLREKRFWRSRLFVTLYLVAIGLVPPLSQWLFGGESFNYLGIISGGAAALSGALIALGYKVLSYRAPTLSVDRVSMLGSAFTASFAMLWIFDDHSWRWADSLSAFGSVTWGSFFRLLVVRLGQTQSLLDHFTAHPK